MCGVELHEPGEKIFQFCLRNRVRINCTHGSVLRMLPAMNVPQEALDEGLGVLEEALQKATDSTL